MDENESPKKSNWGEILKLAGAILGVVLSVSAFVMGVQGLGWPLTLTITASIFAVVFTWRHHGELVNRKNGLLAAAGIWLIYGTGLGLTWLAAKIGPAHLIALIASTGVIAAAVWKRDKIPYRAVIAATVTLWGIYGLGAGIHAVLNEVMDKFVTNIVTVPWWIAGLVELAILSIFGVSGFFVYHSEGLRWFAEAVDLFANWLMYRPEGENAEESTAEPTEPAAEEPSQPSGWRAAINWMVTTIHPTVRWTGAVLLGIIVLVLISHWQWLVLPTIAIGLALVFAVAWWQFDWKSKIHFRRRLASLPLPAAEEQAPTTESEIVVPPDDLRHIRAKFMARLQNLPKRDRIAIAAVLVGAAILVALVLGLIFAGIFSAGNKIDALATQSAGQNSAQNNALTTLAARPSATPYTPVPTVWPTPYIPAPTLAPYDDSGIRATAAAQQGQIDALKNAPTLTPMATVTPVPTATPPPTATPMATFDASGLQATIAAQNAAIAILQAQVATLSAPTPTATPAP